MNTRVQGWVGRHLLIRGIPGPLAEAIRRAEPLPVLQASGLRFLSFDLWTDTGAAPGTFQGLSTCKWVMTSKRREPEKICGWPLHSITEFLFSSIGIAPPQIASCAYNRGKCGIEDGPTFSNTPGFRKSNPAVGLSWESQATRTTTEHTFEAASHLFLLRTSSKVCTGNRSRYPGYPGLAVPRSVL